MSAPIITITEAGDSGIAIAVECHVSNGLPAIIIVGFANKAIDEAKERVRSAFASSKLELPRKRITINLAPADIPKDGTSFDLAIAATILSAAKAVLPSPLANAPIFGELGLSGEVKPVRGIIGKLIAGRSLGYTHFVVPQANLQQAALVPGVVLLPVSTVKQLYLALNEQEALEVVVGGTTAISYEPSQDTNDFKDVVGQARAKRALEIAAAGAHNVLLSGPPGTGKSMLAKALHSILPVMQLDELLEVTHLHSLASRQYDKLITERPFRAPHHSASEMAVIGGGARPRPGEISLAHHGVLFFDELPEYGRATLEALRQPLEDHCITIARAHDSLSFPAKFIFVATANPCPCGFYGSSKPCVCSPSQITHYNHKLSGPILDRIDLYVAVDEVQHASLLAVGNQADVSAAIAKRVTKARQHQRERLKTSLRTNASLSNQEIKQLAQLEPEAQQLLNKAAERLGISARAYMRTIKVARTIADLEASSTITIAHISEALQYRRPPTTI